MTHRVIVVGSYVAGLTIRTERLPVPGESVIGYEWDSGPGGKGSNQAIQASRLGVPVELVARIGRDHYGDAARELWEAERVVTRHVLVDDTAPTGVAFVLLDTNGSNSIVIYPGANRRLSASDVDLIADDLRPGDVVVAQQEIGPEPVSRAMEVARAVGATTILNPAPARLVSAEVLARVDVLTPNATEARTMLGLEPDAPTSPSDLAHGLLKLGARTVVLTLGEAGAIVADHGGLTEIPAARPPRVVDTTGAGDAFTGTLAAMLAGERTITDAVRASVIAGSLACTAMGVVPALPDLAALQAGGVVATDS